MKLKWYQEIAPILCIIVAMIFGEPIQGVALVMALTFLMTNMGQTWYQIQEMKDSQQ